MTRPTPETDEIAITGKTSLPYKALLEHARRLERRRDEAVELLRELLDRVDRNGGLGEYKGGTPFVTKNARAFLAQVDKE